MSEAKPIQRWELFDSEMTFWDDGTYVKYSDHAALQTRLDEAEKEAERLREQNRAMLAALYRAHTTIVGHDETHPVVKQIATAIAQASESGKPAPAPTDDPLFGEAKKIYNAHYGLYGEDPLIAYLSSALNIDDRDRAEKLLRAVKQGGGQ